MNPVVAPRLNGFPASLDACQQCGLHFRAEAAGIEIIESACVHPNAFQSPHAFGLVKPRCVPVQHHVEVGEEFDPLNPGRVPWQEIDLRGRFRRGLAQIIT